MKIWTGSMFNVLARKPEDRARWRIMTSRASPVGGGGNYHTCWHGMCHLVCFFRAENNFWGIACGKITSSD